MEVPYEQTVMCVEKLFWDKDYATLEKTYATKPLQRLWRPVGWMTMVSQSIWELDHHMFRYIIQKHGVGVMDELVCDWEGTTETGYEYLDVITDTNCSCGHREYMIFYEILLEQGADEEHLFRGRNSAFTILSDVWWDSVNNKEDALTAVAWICETIRHAYGVADGLAELVGERMQAESTWEYEPKIKRAKY
jgi:hypothetical protein